jgi:hypothetical protein
MQLKLKELKEFEHVEIKVVAICEMDDTLREV